MSGTLLAKEATEASGEALSIMKEAVVLMKDGDMLDHSTTENLKVITKKKL